MKEFGSDFHRCDVDFRNTVAKEMALALPDIYADLRFYASGRHAIEAIMKYKGWKRLWVPAYFCYEVIDYLVETGIAVKYYDDMPMKEDDDEVVRSLPYEPGDALLRMNYYGLRLKRSNAGIGVPVIEDHTHDMISDWARNSDADYCIASIRKTMPTAAGGILWSAKGLTLPEAMGETEACREMAVVRYEAMEMKHDYLKGEAVDKDAFRAKYVDTEEIIDKLPLSGMDRVTNVIANEMNYALWDELKADNWRIAYERLSQRFHVLKPKASNGGREYPFSVVIVCESAEERTALRMHLIKSLIYPAILWQVPEDSVFPEAVNFSKRMLSVHCDARYSRSDIEEMCERILAFSK